MYNKSFNFIPTLVLFIILFLGGIIGQNILFEWAVSFILSIILFIVYFKFGRLKLPKSGKYYVIFLILFLLSLLWSEDRIVSFRYLFMFFSGGLICLLIYNFKNKKYLLPNMGLAVLLLGIVFGAWFVYKKVLGIYDVVGYDLINYSVRTLDHHHVGDYWAAVMGVIVFILLKIDRKNIFLWALLVFGLYLLEVSSSRSAYVSLGAGMVYLLYEGKSYLKKNIFPILILLGTLLLIVGVTANKGLISHRLFYFQGLSGIYNNPFGVGVGNFSVISLDPKNHLLGIDSYAGVADNIFLEMLTGMGVFGLSFILWFISVAKEIFISENSKKNLPTLVFIILTVNFLFNYVYFIPTMLWLWFFCIGLISANVNQKSLIKRSDLDK